MFDIKNNAPVVVNETENISDISKCTEKELREVFLILENLYMKLTAETFPDASVQEPTCLLDEVKIISGLTARISEISRRLSEIL